MTEFAVANSFFDSAARLGAADKGRVFDFMVKFRANPDSPGISLERVARARDPNVWSARITQGLRAVVHKDGGR
ncbi:MAG TPA: DNA helicase, partial [Candidatus Eisenbacteria bacterium]|nr:DNA helicase [Candidatus Eisenbacteria bacterium]